MSAILFTVLTLKKEIQRISIYLSLSPGSPQCQASTLRLWGVGGEGGGGGGERRKKTN